MNRKTLLNWLPWLLFAGVMLTGLRPIVLGGLQRGLLATGLFNAPIPPRPANAAPVMLAGGAAAAPPAPSLALVNAAGQPLHLEALRGKAVFVNLWATWCPPCRAEMPGIQALYQKVDTSKIAFVMISLDENPAKAQKLMRQQGYTFPVYFPTAPLPAPFDSNSIPSTVVLGPDGTLAVRHDGMADYDTPAFRAWLQGLAATE
ncbi:MAG: TlpA family protein disulfide reductase [Bacteroidota bacterium]|nr:TlpA family protein disulfide reductase [Bacteroidota bacterium]